MFGDIDKQLEDLTKVSREISADFGIKKRKEITPKQTIEAIRISNIPSVAKPPRIRKAKKKMIVREPVYEIPEEIINSPLPQQEPDFIPIVPHPEPNESPEPAVYKRFVLSPEEQEEYAKEME
jgi:hypothetical protein